MSRFFSVLIYIFLSHDFFYFPTQLQINFNYYLDSRRLVGVGPGSNVNESAVQSYIFPVYF